MQIDTKTEQGSEIDNVVVNLRHQLSVVHLCVNVVLERAGDGHGSWSHAAAADINKGKMDIYRGIMFRFAMCYVLLESEVF